MITPGPPPEAERLPQRQVALIDLLDRLLSGGVVLTGGVVLSIAEAVHDRHRPVLPVAPASWQDPHLPRAWTSPPRQTPVPCGRQRVGAADVPTLEEAPQRNRRTP
ncbi:gas vesicle protein GvpJ [Streptomyces sp. NPDC002758]